MERMSGAEQPPGPVPHLINVASLTITRPSAYAAFKDRQAGN